MSVEAVSLRIAYADRYGGIRVLVSPFNPGAGTAPPVLAGREGLLGDAEEMLARATHFGRAGSPLVWTGVRGVGKTVTLHAARRRSEQLGFVTSHVMASLDGRLPERLAEAIATALVKAGITRRGSAWERLAERFAEFHVNVSLAGVVSVGADAEPRVRDKKTTQDMLRSLIVDAAAEIGAAGRAGLLLSFDELQEAPIEDLQILVFTIQELATTGSVVVVLAAGLPALPERLMEAGSFAERFAFRRVGNLTAQAALEALLKPAAALGVRWSERGAERILRVCSGSPYLLQLHGDFVWKVVPRQSGSVISEDESIEGIGLAERALWDGQYRGRWNRATPGERDLLVAIAESLDAHGVARAADIGTRLGKASSGYSRDRGGLIDKGFIEAVGHGQMAFTVPGFERFVRAITEASGSDARPGRHRAPSLEPRRHNEGP